MESFRYALAAVDGAAVPATLFEGMVEGDEGDFHLRIDVMEGELEIRDGNRYRQRLVVAAYIDGNPDQAGPALWTDRGVVSLARAGVFRFESTYIQHVAFDGTIDADGWSITVDLLRHFHDPGAVSRFTFRP